MMSGFCRVRNHASHLVLTALLVAALPAIATGETLTGTAGFDTLVGSSAGSVLSGLNGDDRLYGDAPLTSVAVTRLSVLLKDPWGGAIGQKQFSVPHAFSPDGLKVLVLGRMGLYDKGYTMEGGFEKNLHSGAFLPVTGLPVNNSYGMAYRSVDAIGYTREGDHVFTRQVAGDRGQAVQQIVLRKADGGEDVTVSASSDDKAGNDDSYLVPAAYHARDRVLFVSYADNLAAGATSVDANLFVKNTRSGAVTVVNRSAAGVLGNRGAYEGALSPDGRQVVFSSASDNLVPGDTNGRSDIFVKTLATGSIKRVSMPMGGGQSNGHSRFPSFSPDGTRIIFRSMASNLEFGDTNGIEDVFETYPEGGSMMRISLTQAGGQATAGVLIGSPVFSPDGDRVLFASTSPFVPGDTNGDADLYLKNLYTGALDPVSVTTAGTIGNDSSFGGSFSPDGQSIVYITYANNLSGQSVPTVMLADLRPPTGADDRLLGGKGNDWHFGFVGDDTLLGDDGDDLLDGGPGDDSMTGGEGEDTYMVDSKGDRVIEAAGKGKNTVVSTVDYDLPQGVTHAILSGNGNRDLTGNDLDNTLIGNAGDNHLKGGAGDDILEGMGGKDKLDGGKGNDTVSYAQAVSGGVYEMGKNNISGGMAKGDTFISIENIIGSIHNDAIGGDQDDNILDGGPGGDTIFGGGGNDKLFGGPGNDHLSIRDGIGVLNGGPGGDLIDMDGNAGRIVYLTPEDSPSDNPDIIHALNHKVATIDLSKLNKFLPKKNDELKYIGEEKFSKEAGEVRFKGGELEIDLDGDGKQDFSITITKKDSLPKSALKL